MDGQSLAMGGQDVGTVPAAAPSAMEILARQRELAQGAPPPALGQAPSPESKQQKKAERKLEKAGVRTRFSFQIPMDLGLDRRMTVTGPATMDEHAGGKSTSNLPLRQSFHALLAIAALVQLDAIVPPGGQSGQVWHFKVQPGEPGELWTVRFCF